MGTDTLGIPVVGGDPGALEDAAAECRSIAGGFARISGQLASVGQPDGWSGVAATAASGRFSSESETIASGTNAFADASRVYDELADELRSLTRAVDRLREDAEHADRARTGQATAADESDRAAIAARTRSMLAGSQADAAELTASPSAASHREQQARELSAAQAAAEQAAAHRQSAARLADELDHARETASRKVAHYKAIAAEAGARLQAIAAAAPQVNTVYGRPVATLDSPSAPGKVVPVLPRVAAPPKKPKDEGFLDGVRENLEGLAALGRSIGPTQDPLGRPSLDVWDSDRTRQLAGGVWHASKTVVTHPLETAKDLTYRPYTDAYREGGLDKAAGFGAVDVAAVLATAGYSKVATGARRTATVEDAAAATARGGHKAPVLDRKLEFVFGNATGRRHSVLRSVALERELHRIGIRDDALGRDVMTEHLERVYNERTGVLLETGTVEREGLLMGPHGTLKTKTIWDGPRLMTVILKAPE